MKDENKTKRQLIDELVNLRLQKTEWERPEARRNRVEEACDTCDGFAPPDQAAATADTLFPAANVTEAPMWDALARAVDDARAYAGTYGGSPAVVLLTAGDDLGSAAGSADVALMTVGPPRVPILAVHLDRPAALEAVHDRLAPLEDLAWASEGTYARMETADDLPQALDLARLATGPRLRLTIDLAAALTDPGPPPGSLARIELDFVLTLAGMDLGLGGARLPVLIR